MDIDALGPLEKQSYLRNIQRIKDQNVIVEKGFLELFGHTESGDLVIAPNSFTRGYRDSFLPPTQRPYVEYNLLGIFGRLSNDTWIFIPSYNKGMTYGEHKQNDLKFVVLAEGERRLFDEMQSQRIQMDEQKQIQKELEKQLKDAREQINQLQKRITK